MSRRSSACSPPRPPPWQRSCASAPSRGRCGPLQARPLLRLGDDVVVLDERYLIERVTRGLYWLVHDHEKNVHGESARGSWTQVWSEMVETRVEDQLRRMAPSLFGGGRAFFTEEDLQSAFPRTKNCDAGIDFGGDVVLAEVVSGTVKVQTRELADVALLRRGRRTDRAGQGPPAVRDRRRTCCAAPAATSPVEVPPSGSSRSS